MYQPGCSFSRRFIALNSASSSSFLGSSRTDGSRSALRPEDAQQRGVAAIVEDHVGEAAVAPGADPVHVVPVLVERLALDREHRRAAGGDGGRGVVLGREDVARRPADVGAQRLQRLDQHRGLDGHVQAAGDPRALERLLRRRTPSRIAIRPGISVSAIAISRAAPVGEADVGDHVVGDVLINAFLEMLSCGGRRTRPARAACSALRLKHRPLAAAARPPRAHSSKPRSISSPRAASGRLGIRRPRPAASASMPAPAPSSIRPRIEVPATVWSSLRHLDPAVEGLGGAHELGRGARMQAALVDDRGLAADHAGASIQPLSPFEQLARDVDVLAPGLLGRASPPRAAARSGARWRA